VAEKDDYLIDLLVDLGFVGEEQVVQARKEAEGAGVGVVDLMVANQLIRPADGTLTKPGRPRSPAPKRQVTLRLDPEVLEKFRSTGKGWQSRINAELRKVLGL